MGEEKSRKEKRKEARLAKQKERHLSWMEHQKSSWKAKASLNSKKVTFKHPEISTTEASDEVERKEGEWETKKSTWKSDSKDRNDGKNRKVGKEKKKDLKRKRKTKFEEYIETEMKGGLVCAADDLELERKLAKKLKVKGGLLRGVDDGINFLFDGFSSLMGSASDDEYSRAKALSGNNADHSSSIKKKLIQKRKSADYVKDLESDDIADSPIEEDNEELEDEVLSNWSGEESQHQSEDEDLVDTSGDETGQEQVNNVLDDMAGDGTKLGSSAVDVNKEKDQTNTESNPVGTYIAPHLRSHGNRESEEFSQIRRRIRGLLNRLSESNVESITGEISSIFQSVVRSVGCQIIGEEVLSSCSGGPRGNEQYAAVFAAFVAGMACLVGVDFSAKLIASLAKLFEEKYLEEDSLSMRNLTLLLSYLCVFGVCSSDLLYDFLFVLSQRLTELDVSTILTVLQCGGMKLRADDPAAMKDFILNVQNRVHDVKSFSGSTVDGKSKFDNKRMEFMLDTICDIKNNRRRGKEDSTHHTRIKKWLQKLRVENVLLRGLKWSKLLDPEKKGQWWFSGDVSSTTDNVEEVANTIDKEATEAQKLLQLAAAQRMNTDTRRAIFCVIMSGEDYIDAFEKLLRLDLSGKQDREIMRILVECCLQEKVFNKYYTVLASKLCGHDKNHKFTLQFCLWDHFKELESMELIRLMNLARFTTEVLASFSLSLAVLKSVDLSDPKQLTSKRVMYFRMLFEFIFEKSDALVWNIFTRIAAAPELEALRSSILFFAKHYILSTNKSIAGKFKLAKKALANVEGVLM